MATHLSRIGYYFNSQLVAQACDKLGYIPYKKAFIKEADLAVQSRMARTMADYGVVGEIQAVEDDSQVRAAMKELFPMMPQHDVEAIIQHAWHGDGSTVGNNMTLSLSRRIQLATGARIRHTYTDYDRLLRAFGTWQEVRAIVEPDCLEKIKEWRGENDEEEKEENEWIWHDIIVIEDEEDEANKMKMKDDDNNNQNTHMHDADDSDSVVILDDSSEASFDTTDRQARGADMNMETEDEAFTRGRMDRRIRRPQSQESNEAYLYGFTNGCKGRRISDEAAPPPLLAYPQPMAPQQPLRWQHQQPQAGGGVGYGQYQPYHAGAVLPRREEAQATTARDMVIGGRVYQRVCISQRYIGRPRLTFTDGHPARPSVLRSALRRCDPVDRARRRVLHRATTGAPTTVAEGGRHRPHDAGEAAGTSPTGARRSRARAAAPAPPSLTVVAASPITRQRWGCMAA